MPLFEYECDKCMDRYNKDIDLLAAKLNKTNASKIHKSNQGIEYIEVTDLKTKKSKFSIGDKEKRDIRRFKWTINKSNVLYMELKNFRFSELIYEKEEEKNLKCPIPL